MTTMTWRPDRMLAMLCLVGGAAACTEDLPPGLGDRIPESEFQVIHAGGSAFQVDERIALSDLRGKPLFLDFWASWCGPCRGQHEYLAGLKEEYGEQIQILGILTEDTRANGLAWLEREGAHFPVVLEPGKTLTEEFWVSGLPRLALLTPDGRLSWDQLGFGTGFEDSITVRLETMLGSAAGPAR
jgi:thiol-disulfide isomerase/thioredoxin